MKEALAGLIGSKKALAAIGGAAASALALLASKYGYGLDAAATQTLIQSFLGLVGLYIVGQGAADWGKEKAKVEAAAMEFAMKAHKLELDELEADDDDLKVLTEDI